MKTPQLQDEEPLRRELSRLAIGVLALNGLVGAGIFGLPAPIARLTGSFSPVLFVLCGLLMLTVMLSFAQAASYFRETGGPILYTQTAFGPFAGFETGWILYIGRATSLAANANLLATYTAQFVDGLDRGAARVAFIFCVCLVFTSVNILGIRQGMGSVFAITVLKLLPLALFVLVGLRYLTPSAFASANMPGYGQFGEATILLFYAFIGFEGSLIPAGETRNPRRDIPRALVVTGLVTTVIYVLIQAVSVAVLPDLGASKRPLADVASAMVGPVGAVLVSLGALVSIGGNIAASILSAPRMTYKLARDRGLPAWFAAVHPTYRTPHRSIAFYGALAFALAASGTFESLVGMGTLTRICGYGACVAAVPILRRRFAGAEDALRLPGGLAIPTLALLICLWLLTQVKLVDVAITIAFMLAGGLLYRRASRRTPDDAPAGR